MFLDSNDNGSTIYQNLRDTMVIAVNAHFKGIEQSQINSLTMYLKILEKQQSKSEIKQRKKKKDPSAFNETEIKKKR